jgi:hypothetical protein
VLRRFHKSISGLVATPWQSSSRAQTHATSAVLWSRYAEPPARFGLIAGDAIHNIRSSLDHMVVALAKVGASVAKENLTPPDERRLQFPIALDSDQFDRHLKAKRLKWVPDGAVLLSKLGSPTTWSRLPA